MSIPTLNKEALESFANLSKNSQLSSFKTANPQLSIFWKGKGYVDKPIEPFFALNSLVLLVS